MGYFRTQNNPLNSCSSFGRNKWLNCKLLVLVVATMITVKLVDGLGDSHKGQDDPADPLPASASPLPTFNEAAVVSVGTQCAPIGRDILKKGGNAVEAAIATMICDGVVRFDVMGIGGGFVMNIYQESGNKSYILNAKETAPAAAKEDMFKGKTLPLEFGSITAAVPGQLKGYQEAFKKFGSGKVKWDELFEPSIHLCENGFPVTKELQNIINSTSDKFNKSSSLSGLLMKNGTLVVEKDVIKLPQLAKTLKTIASSKQQADEFYKGTLTKEFVADIKSDGGIITEKDLEEYKVLWQDAVVTGIGGGTTTYISTPLPSSGVFHNYILAILNDGFMSSHSVYDSDALYHAIEAFKYAFALRAQYGDGAANKTDFDTLFAEDALKKIRDKIGQNSPTNNSDPKFYGAKFEFKEDYGGASVVVYANGTAVSVTSSINSNFGCKFISKSTGILLNNEMDSFSVPACDKNTTLPPSSANFIKPGKRAMSSMAPTIVLDDSHKILLVTGSSGGARIMTSTALVEIFTLWYGKDIKIAVDIPRIHHQFSPAELFYEYGLIQKTVAALKGDPRNYTMVRTDRASGVSIIMRSQGKFLANSDWYLNGGCDGY